MRTFSLPDQTGHIGEVLHTNGENVYWAAAGGGGTGIVNTVTGIEPIFIDATDPANIIASLAYDGTLFVNVLGQLSVVGGVPALTSLVATTTVLPGSPTYNNGVGGVGATITRTGNGALGTIDGVTLSVGSRILVKDYLVGTTPTYIANGIYEVTQLGNAGAPYILTRTSDADDTLELEDQIVVVSAGTVNKGLIFTQITNAVTVGTSPIVYQNITTLYVTQQGSGTQVAGQIPFWTATARQLSKGVAQLFWDNTNKRLGLGTSTPAQQLHITGAFRFPSTTNSTTGVFYKDTVRIFHAYKPAGANENLFLGTNAGNFTLSATSNFNANVGIGQNVFSALTLGYFNTAVGPNAGQFMTTGHDNHLFGLQAGRNVTTGTNNVYAGSSAGYGGSGIGTNTGSFNVAIGDTAMYEVTSGSRNVAMGFQAMLGIRTGVDNVGIGYQAGLTNQTGSRLTIIGSLADTSNIAWSDSIALGYAAIITGSNQMIVGSDSTNIDDIYLGRGFEQTTPGSVTIHATGGTGADIAGATMIFAAGIGTGDAISGDLIFKTSIAGVGGTGAQALGTAITIKGDDQRVLMSSRFEGTSASVAAANDLTLTAANLFIITGNTTINAITTTNWQAGSEITLVFTGTPTVKHNTAGGAGTARIFLAGSVDLSATNNTVLKLGYDGTQWQEISRKIP